MSPSPVDLAGLVIRATLICVLAAVADLCLRRRASAAARHFLWTMTLAAVLALPLASLALPVWSIEIPIVSAVTAVPAVFVERQPVVDRPASTAPSAAPISTSPAPIAPRRHFDPVAFAFALYSAGVVLFVVKLAGEQVALSRLVRASRPVDAEDWGTLVDAAARQLGIHRPVRLLEADEDVMPFTFGTRRPTIVIPSAAEAWTGDRRRAVIVHELAHVARADCLVQRLAAFACAIYWPHPGVWWAIRRLRVEREHACDDLVLSMGTAAREYADHLLEIAHAFRATPAPATALGMARARQLEHRLLAVIDDARNRAALNGGRKTAAVVAAAALLLPITSLHAEFVPAATGTTGAGRTFTSGRTLPSATNQRRDRSSDRFTTADYSGTWHLRMSKEPGMVQVGFETDHWNSSHSMPLSRFEGLNEPGMTAAVRDGHIVDGNVHFTARRDAGTFTLDGVCKNQMCGGTFSFAPDPAFASALAKYGIGAPTASEQYELALEDVGLQYLEGLKAEGYAVPDVRTLVRAAEHGVSLDYVKGMAALGYKLGTLEPLIRMRDHGVDPAYVQGMAEAGFKSLTADQLVRARDHGVDPQYVKGMRDLGLLTSATLDDLIKTRDHGVDPSFVRDMAAAGYRGLSMADLTRARDHGADPQFAAGLAALGYKNLSLDTLVEARDHGVDPEYVGAMASLGYKNVPIESLIRMRDHGVDASYVRRLQQRGVDHLSVDELIRLRDGGDDDRNAAVRAALAAFRSYYRSLLATVRSYRL